MGKSTREAYGLALAELGEKNDKVVVLDADLSGSTKTGTFKKVFPDRFYNFGIAEADMMCAAAGFAFSGYTPFASTFAVFGTGRAFEQIRNSIAYTKANVKMAFTHAGISVGEDGGSHQSLEDIALMRTLPNVTVFCPCDAAETKKAVMAAAEMDGPVYLRLGRSSCDDVTDENTPFVPGKAVVLKEGTDAAIFATGLMVSIALKAAAALDAEGVSTAVVDFHTIKPFDEETVLAYNGKVKVIVTAEEAFVVGGLGSAVAETIAGKGGAKFARVGVEDKFGQSGNPNALFELYGLTVENIIAKVKGLL